MPSDVYWHDDFDMVEVYVRAFEKKQEIENKTLWLQGAYNYRAFETVVGNAFKGKNDKALTYPEEPFELRPKPEEPVLSDAEKLYNKFRPLMTVMNSQRLRKGCKDG